MGILKHTHIQVLYLAHEYMHILTKNIKTGTGRIDTNFRILITSRQRGKPEARRCIERFQLYL